MEDGLSSDSITDIFQDDKGFLWLATQDGLNRYDGNSLKHYLYSPKDSNTLSAPWINSVIEDQNGLIWVGTDNGLNIIDPVSDTVQRIFASKGTASLSANRVGDLYLDASNTIWMLADGILNKYSSDKQKVTHQKFYAQSGEQLKIKAFQALSDWQFLLGTENKGLYLYSPQSDAFTPLRGHFIKNAEIVSVAVSTLYISSNNTLWVGTASSGLFKVDMKDLLSDKVAATIAHIPASGDTHIKELIEDQDNTLWAATNSGLAYSNQAHDLNFIRRNPRDSDSLVSDEVNTIFIDESGIFWVGTFSGISKWNTFSKYFTNIDADGIQGVSLSGADVTGIDIINHDKILVSNLKGLDLVTISTGKVENIPVQLSQQQGLAEAEVMSVKYRHENEIWVGYRNKGVSKFNPKTLEFNHYEYKRDDTSSIGAAGIPYILRLANIQKDMWFTTFGGGISLYNESDNAFISYARNEDDQYTLSSNRVISAYESSEDLIWLGTLDDGINIFNPRTKSNYRVNGLLDTQYKIKEIIRGFTEDGEGNMWVATNGRGLLYISAETLQAGRFDYQMLVREDGLPSNSIAGIEYAADGYIWASTYKGLVKVNPKTFEMKVFTTAHGLKDNNFNSMSHTQLPDGRLVFGSTSGISIFDPKQLAKEQRHFPIEITQFHKLNTVYNPAVIKNSLDEIVVQHDDYLVGFEFAGLDYVSPDDNKFKYRLIGFDPDWVDASEGNKAVYTNLPSGDYTFQVIGANSDGHWNEEGASIKLVVKPPIWLSFWAYIVYFFMFMLVILVAARMLRLRNEREKRYLEKLENDVSERTQELQRLNTELLNASVTDQLTGLHNRRYLNNVLPGVAKEALQKFTAVIAGMDEQSLGDSQVVAPRIFFLMFDMDGFKPVNDTYGHDVGDKVIEQVADLLKDVCRVNDIVVRWGGDEFLIVGHVNQAKEATQLAERVRSVIASHEFDLGISQPIHLSSSIGFSLYPFSQFSPEALTWDHVHILADNALYESKGNGRNTWTGILPKNELLPYSALNQITANVEAAIQQGFVELVSHKKS
ncbi:hypothetical protein GCM10007852_31840 [Agaribacter marinus]|uniref:GGDEF domain-containing protein n=2 Tax=Agaribacter marinus TaxID=1431249 RepID=A0AA37SZG1_9ALTE|nr:hypothetical protein GCM10007852_31840 [Agaribacter marinus]